MRRHRLSQGPKRGPARPKPAMHNPLLLAEVRVARMQQGRWIEIPTDATSDGAKGAPQGPDNGGTLNPRAPSNAR